MSLVAGTVPVSLRSSPPFSTNFLHSYLREHGDRLDKETVSEGIPWSIPLSGNKGSSRRSISVRFSEIPGSSPVFCDYRLTGASEASVERRSNGRTKVHDARFEADEENQWRESPAVMKSSGTSLAPAAFSAVDDRDADRGRRRMNAICRQRVA